MEQKNITCRVTKTSTFKAVNFDDVLNAINSIGVDSAEGFTTQDMVEATGHDEKWCRKQIKRLINDGKMEYAGKVARETIDGRVCKISAYRMINDSAGDKS